ncbi:hypothetical protein DdX_13757 [Ditylenchus destructor]|uniref:Uncharacterized protein n=1 Tax=Ditylenchus destructor TaxID=166010 RepID=A0AAD4R2L5_9BILA|nr:hypothetical protein DdX_13757 [Ditylenchus destructor]
MRPSFIYYILIASVLSQIPAGDGEATWAPPETDPPAKVVTAFTDKKGRLWTPATKRPLQCKTNKTEETKCQEYSTYVNDASFLGTSTCHRAIDYIECLEKLYEGDRACESRQQELLETAKERLIPDQACYCCNETYHKMLEYGGLNTTSGLSCVPDRAKSPVKDYECVTCKFGPKIFERIFEHAKTCDELLSAGRKVANSINIACNHSGAETLIQNYFTSNERFILEKVEYCNDTKCDELTAFMQSHVAFTLQFKLPWKNKNCPPIVSPTEESTAARRYDHNSAILWLLGATGIIMITFNFHKTGYI